QDIRAVQESLENDVFAGQKEIEAKALALWNQDDKMGARNLLTQYSDSNAAAVLEDWWKLAELLYVKYNDGYINTDVEIGHPVFYPAWWLEQVGYKDGPTSYEKRSPNP
ncbi:MAG: dipeptidase, partial [Deltaproteobacteria bacterium]|nr:dipeptidase [Deltaproteobacteria bacterium]